MKTILKFVSAFCLLAAISIPTKAALITQELLEGDSVPTVVGSITIDTAGAFIDTAFGTGTVDSALQFSYKGQDLSLGDIVFFEATYNINNWFAGLEFLNFDINYIAPGIDKSVQGIVDTFGDPSFNIFNVWDNITGDFNSFGPLSLGKVSVVSEPGTFALFGMMLALLVWRRKAH